MHSLADRGTVEQRRAMWASTIAVTICFAHGLQRANAAAGLGAVHGRYPGPSDRAAASLQLRLLAALPQDGPHGQAVAHVERETPVMATTAERMRAHRGPAILSYGFRPFFLFGAIWAALVVAIWLPMLGGWLAVPTALSPLEWHVHELVYGYVPAIVAGFLLTAVPNWTGRLPVTGTPLLALVSVWAAGRLAVLLSARIGAPVAAAIDLLFLACLAGVIAREIIAGPQSWQSQGARSGRTAFHRQRRFSRGSEPDERRQRLRHPHRHRRRCASDHSDRRSHHSKLHAQLACAAIAGTAADCLRSVRRGQPCLGRSGDRLLDRLSARVDHRRLGGSGWRVARVAPRAMGGLSRHAPSRWFWCCMLATPLYRSASCC